MSSNPSHLVAVKDVAKADANVVELLEGDDLSEAASLTERMEDFGVVLDLR